MKKLLAAILALVMMLSMVAVASADSDYVIRIYSTPTPPSASTGW